ncbi:MAG: hypothetical protein KJ042_12840, partial [Deltaproteobacteria bacterium]|nr:hypothetical protein [Deltaproteobacteria bacterium]
MSEKRFAGRIGWCVLAIAVALCVLADTAWSQTANGRVEGRLVRKDDGIPVDGARIAVKDGAAQV